MLRVFLLSCLTCAAILSFTPVLMAQDDPPPPIAIASSAERGPQGSTVRGRVYFEDTGRPVKRSSIMLMKVNEGAGPGEINALTDGNGEFVVRGVSAGKYYAIVNAPGVMSPLAFLNWAEIRNGPEKGLEEAVKHFEQYSVDGVTDTVLQVAAKRGGAISGRVIYENGDPGIGIRVEILRKSEGKFLSVISNFSSIMSMFGGMGGGGSTDDRGVYRFAGLPPGEYIVVASENAKHTKSGSSGPDFGGLAAMFGNSSFLRFFYPDVTEESEAKILEVSAGNELTEINVIIPDRGLFKIAGKIISAKDKKPLPKARVFLEKKGSNITSFTSLISREMNFATSDEEGRFDFAEIPRGEYSIRVEPNNSGPDTDYDEEIAYSGNTAVNARTPKPTGPPPPKYAKKFQNIKIEDNDLSDVIIELGYGATVSGSITVANNKPMPSMVSVTAAGEKEEAHGSASVWNQQAEGSTSRSGYASNTAVTRPQKPNNDFKMENVTPGKVHLRFTVSDGKYYIKSANSGPTDLMTDPINIADGDMISNIKVVVADDAGTLTGKVLNHRNEPVGGANVLIVPTDIRKRSLFFQQSARTDLTGKFEIKLPPGEYAVILADKMPGDARSDDYNKWFEEAMRLPEKISLDANGSASITLKKPEN